MDSQLFEQLGLSPNEAKIYESLLQNRRVAVSTITLKSGVHRRNVYDALQRLIEKGLVYRIIGEGENRFEAVHPHKLMEVIKEKEHRLDTAMPELVKLFEKDASKESVAIYKGVEGFKNYMRDLVRVAQDTYFLGAKALWYSPGVDRTYLDDFVRVSKQKKLKYKTLYDPRVPEKFPQALKNVGGQYKILPRGYETTGVLDIFGDYVVTFTSVDVANFGEDGTIVVMVNRELAESYRTWFNLIWDLCPSFNNSMRSRSAGNAPTPSSLAF
ncbi:hypothetical protein HZA86_03710 [Candidatus Uhrbacteria bacterium]|nr:hypothetical protein [Candidatus Uhrbacteria bacterium]